ncbi:MAG: TIGR03086 family metal-binding protein [Acidimicrobiales bacterium]|nr:TIGR03086 family metal-binding protein [Acidimicrobiales bacterium]
MDTPLVALVDRAVDDTARIVAAVQPDDLERPTPCADFDVRALLAHLIGGLDAFAVLAETGEMRFEPDPDITAETASSSYRAAAERLRAAWRAPGVLDRTYQAPWGESTAEQLLGFALIELTTHGWDLARATGQTRTVDADLAEAALAGARASMDDSVRVPGLFGPEVSIAADAAAPDRLAAFLGRQP